MLGPRASMAIVTTMEKVSRRTPWPRPSGTQRRRLTASPTPGSTNRGVCFETGKGVVQDLYTASAWPAKAAAQGDPIAQYNLGVFYDIGTGVAQDFKAAASWYAKAAAQGHTSALYTLGAHCKFGNGVAQDFKTAAVW